MATPIKSDVIADVSSRPRMNHRPRILIITGFGLNCEAESHYAWQQAGAAPECVHLNDLLADPARLEVFDGLMFIGGFSFGDHMTSGHVFATRLRHRLREPLERFMESGRLILGVCNGFQIMVKLGLLPGLDGDYFRQRVALLQNEVGHFQNFWVDVRFEQKSPCVFSRGLERLPLPIRHGEGRFYVPETRWLDHLEANGCIACRYVDPATGKPTMVFPHNPNGSVHAIAGLCDPSGRIFGLMPHPEAYIYPENHPHWDRRRFTETAPHFGEGLRIFENAVAYLRS